MLLTGSELRVLQIHPTRRCNLRCLHCYSSSAPEERDALSVALLGPTIRDAAELGYNMVSISGGEPLLYPDLSALLKTGRDAGMITALVTNGLLLNPTKIRELAGSIDLIAISLDGAPERHNWMRNAPHAFEHMEQRLSYLRDASLAFGFVFTLTNDNLYDLEWAANFAVEQGAVLLQIHPLEPVGRAAGMAGLEPPSDIEAARAWLIAERLQEIHSGKLHVAFDFVRPREAASLLEMLSSFSVAGRISPLVIEDDGSLVPLQYGFPRQYSLGNLRQESLPVLAARWQASGAEAFEQLRQTAIAQLRSSESLFVDLYDRIARAAQAPIERLCQIAERATLVYAE